KMQIRMWANNLSTLGMNHKTDDLACEKNCQLVPKSSQSAKSLHRFTLLGGSPLPLNHFLRFFDQNVDYDAGLQIINFLYIDMLIFTEFTIWRASFIFSEFF